jgi:predicted nucleic acid-binding protein
MKLYFDSSALMKLLINETGAEWAIELWHGPEQKFACSVAYAEVRAALAAAHRGRRISDNLLFIAKRKFDLLWQELRVVTPDRELVHDAGELAERHALRGFDALHLASAVNMRTSAIDYDVLMVSWDADLATAARDAGMSVLRTASG